METMIKTVMRTQLIALVLAALAGPIGPALAQEWRVGDITVKHAWARASIGKAKNGVAYLTLSNHGAASDRLVRVASPAAKMTSLHSSRMEGGMVMMQPVKAVEVGPGAPVVLKPEGLHVMLMGLKAPLKEGESFPLSLTFEKAGSVEIVIKIQGPAAMEPGHRHKSHAPSAPKDKQAGGAPCRIPVQISEEADRQPGGALYAGPAAKNHDHGKMPMADMAGAHMVHEPQHGGAFFMAPNKLNHLEAVYSEDCGFRVFFYNAFTRPVHADRFRAFIRIVPKAEDEPEVLRFLSPSDDKTLLSAPIGNEVSRPFAVELYVEFPGSHDPELFTVQVPRES
jgi:copper(I)-binding protein